MSRERAFHEALVRLAHVPVTWVNRILDLNKRPRLTPEAVDVTAEALLIDRLATRESLYSLSFAVGLLQPRRIDTLGLYSLTDFSGT